MTDFEHAVAFVHATLEAYAERQVKVRASVAALARFTAAAGEFRACASAAVFSREGLQEDAAQVAEYPAAAERRNAAFVQVLSSNYDLLAPDAPRVAPRDGTKAERLAAMRGPVLACTLCPHLVRSRTQVVFGVGNPDSEVMFVGEAPGADEDVQGEPFVGLAGQLLTKIIAAMGFERRDIYIANVLKCRPNVPLGETGNRKPRPDEMATCLPYLREQIEIIRPRVLVALGATAVEGLTGQTLPMARLRGRWHDFGGVPLMATYHPAYLLRNQALGEKRKVWEDMLMVLERIGREVTDKQRGFFLPKG